MSLPRQLLCVSICIAMLSSSAHGQCEVAQFEGAGGLGSIVFDGDIALLGDVEAFGNLGAVYVFRRGPAGPDDWALEATLMSPNPDPDDCFGARNAVSGDVIVLGAPCANTPEFEQGSAYVFRHNGADWVDETTLTASDGDVTDHFGQAVSIDGDVILVSAREDEPDDLYEAGSAYVYRYHGAQWVEEAKLTDPNAEEGDAFGSSVAIRGDVALIGAASNNDAGSGTGAAFVFRRDPKGRGAWVLEQQLQAVDAQWLAWFGFSVTLAEDVALIGAPELDSQIGAAYVIRYDGESWVHEAKLLASDPVGPWPFFGESVSIDAVADTIIVGAPRDRALGTDAGAAYLFRKDADGWQEVTKLLASDGAAGDYFGGTVSIGEDLALIRGGGGTVYAFAGIQSLDCNENAYPDACDIFDGTSEDQDGDGIPDECNRPVTPGDLDGDGDVDGMDLLILLGGWGSCGDCSACPADLDGDCVVGASDLIILLGNWG